MRKDKKSRIAYIVSMFPCWSETFILNELIEHKKEGMELSIYSLKRCTETAVHRKATLFLKRTYYPYTYLDPRIFLSHLLVFVSSPKKYLYIMTKILRMKTSSLRTKIVSLAVFLLSARFVIVTKKDKIRHLHSHFATYPSLLAWIISKYTSIPFTITAHAHDIYVNQDILQFIAGDATKIVTISEFNKQFIRSSLGHHIDSKVRVIHCGIDVEKFRFRKRPNYRCLSTKKLFILSIGRLSGIKGFEYLVDSCKLLEKEAINFTCMIIGDGPLRSSLRSRVSTLGLEGKVVFLGTQTDDKVRKYLEKCDVFILACARDKVEGHDGIPVVFMEAMASGVPVIGTAISGIPELIKHLETGLCVEPENSKAIKEAILFFMENPDEVEKMRIKARRLVESEFNIKVNAADLRSLFYEILNQGKH